MISLRLQVMKSIIHFLFGVVILITTQFSGIAQEAKTFDVVKDDVESMLPPLSALIDSALAHNSYVKYRDNQIIVNEANLKTKQSQWTRNIGIQTDVRYGTFNNFNNNTQGGQTPDIYSTLTTEFNYGVGAYLKIPFDEMFDRKNLVKTAKLQLEQANNMAGVQRDELRQLVIRQYNQLILSHRLLRIQSKYLEITRFNQETADKDFHSGTLTVNEYSRISELTTNAETDFQKVKSEFNTSYLILEELVGMKFHLTK